MELHAAERRVAGCLMEKQLTTPQQYPLTLNALTLACNQTSNRDPVTSFTEQEVEEAARSLKVAGLVRFVHPSHGRSALRYEHTLDQALGLDTRGLALLAVLLLRGPQTLGELRVRTERMAAFTDLADVEHELQRLAAHPDVLVACLGRRPGQKEDRYAHRLGAPGADEPADQGEGGDAAGEPTPPGTAESPFPQPAALAPALAVAPAVAPEHRALHDTVRSLQEEVAALRRELDEVRSELGLGLPAPGVPPDAPSG